ncbi:MAG: hypothetical protein WCA09_17325 [Burkholderiales bacterium]
MRLPDGARLNRLLAAAALVAAMWGVRAELPAGPALHFLGAAALYLMFGAPLALAGMALAAALACALERYSPPNLFVYVFGAAFAGAGLSMVASLGAHRLLGSSIEPFAALGLMLGFGEGFLTGALVTLFVVYRREWVATFDDARYLARR